MRRSRIGVDGPEVTALIFGTWQFGGAWGMVERTAAIDLIRFARDRGVTTFDTARAYGNGAAERVLGDALRDDLRHRRDEIVIATKGGLRMGVGGGLRDASEKALREDVNASLAALAVDYIDLYQIHHPDPHTPIEESIAVLASLQEEGKIRHVGVSNYTVAHLKRACQSGPVVSNQVAYHLFRREIEADLLPFARERDMGVLIYGPLAHGLLTGTIDGRTTFDADDWRSTSPAFQGDARWRNVRVVEGLALLARRELGISIAQLAFAWTLRDAVIDGAIMGPQSTSDIDEAVAVSELTIDSELWRQVDTLLAEAVPFVTTPVFER